MRASLDKEILRVVLLFLTGKRVWRERDGSQGTKRPWNGAMLKMPGSAVYKLAQEGKIPTHNVVVCRQGCPKSLGRFREIFPSAHCGTRYLLLALVIHKETRWPRLNPEPRYPTLLRRHLRVAFFTVVPSRRLFFGQRLSFVASSLAITTTFPGW